MKSKSLPALLAIATLMSSTAAQAADSVYLGDCTRARTVLASSTIDKLLPHKRYEGVQRIYDTVTTDKVCGREQVNIDTLTQKTRSAQKLVFTLKSITIEYGLVPDCVEAKAYYGERTGEVTFTSRIDERDGICEVYIWSDWQEKVTYDPNWNGASANRVLFMEGGNFTVTSLSNTPTNYQTPIAYIGIQ